MPLAKRIIPCLDVDNGKVVKGVNFLDVREVGDPVELARRYSNHGADELVFLDITASEQGRDIMKDIVKRVAEVMHIPFTVGGGIKKLEDAREILLNGADKVTINTAGVKNPKLITELMSVFGRQCIVSAIDVKRNYDFSYNIKNYFYHEGKKFWLEVMIYGGKQGTGIDAVEWARQVKDLGAGEILLTSIDTDGTENGFDIEITDIICKVVDIPIIASGGCGNTKHMLDIFTKTNADAALAASIFHFDKISIQEVKSYLKENNIAVRI